MRSLRTLPASCFPPSIPAKRRGLTANALALKLRVPTNRISDIMRSLSEGESPEEALKSSIHDDYAQLEEEFARHLR